MTYFKETNADSLIKQPIFLVVNSQLFLLYNFSKFLYIFTLFIHPSTLNITKKTLTFYLDYLLSIFLQKLCDYYPLFSSIYIYIYISYNNWCFYNSIASNKAFIRGWLWVQVCFQGRSIIATSPERPCNISRHHQTLSDCCHSMELPYPRWYS